MGPVSPLPADSAPTYSRRLEDIKWVGIESGSPGLAGHPNEFRRLCHDATGHLGLSAGQAIKDYWLISALYAVASRPESCRIVHGETGETMGETAFAGGTALVSAWNVSERHSDDLDLVIFAAAEQPSRQAIRKLLSQSQKPLPGALGATAGPVKYNDNGAQGFRNIAISMGDRKNFLRIESTVESPPAGLPLFEERTVMSAMGRFASEQQRQRFPELGGFQIQCVTPAYTALNKFDALHRRAVAGQFGGITQRGRDLYDLARTARSEHGEQVRPLLEASTQRVARPLSRRKAVPRPEAGYGTSVVFTSGSQAYEALEEGYAAVVERLVWKDAPDFEEAVELAVSLDSA